MKYSTKMKVEDSKEKLHDFYEKNRDELEIVFMSVYFSAIAFGAGFAFGEHTVAKNIRKKAMQYGELRVIPSLSLNSLCDNSIVLIPKK